MNSAFDCLVIDADFVSIDLAGFSISGGGGAAIATAPSSSHQGIEVRNGAMFELAAGVLLTGDYSIVEGLRILADQPNGGIGISASGIVRNNTVSGGRNAGIVATGIISGNYVDGRDYGIQAGQGSTVIGNRAMGTFVGGIVAACPSNITDNTVIGQLVLNGDGCSNTNNVAVLHPSPAP